MFVFWLTFLFHNFNKNKYVPNRFYLLDQIKLKENKLYKVKVEFGIIIYDEMLKYVI